MMLIDFCKVCPKQWECDNTPPHPYNNVVWHSCIHKNEIVDSLMSKNVANYEVSYGLIKRCDKCLLDNVRGRYILGVAVCYECYPYKEDKPRRDISACAISFDIELVICNDCSDFVKCCKLHKYDAVKLKDKLQTRLKL